MYVINFVNPAILMSYARSQYGIGNTQILIDLAWVLQRTSTLEKIYMLKYGRVIVEYFTHI